MKKIKTKKLVFKKVNVVELNTDEARTVYGGSSEIVIDPVTDPRSVYTGRFCFALQQN